MSEHGETVTSACPSCGEFRERETYDIGSGPELCCVACEWCWGAEGQDLIPYTADAELLRSLLTDNQSGTRIHLS
jgi:hypothetical protein